MQNLFIFVRFELNFTFMRNFTGGMAEREKRSGDDEVKLRKL
jgi:hypothetical protein